MTASQKSEVRYQKSETEREERERARGREPEGAPPPAADAAPPHARRKPIRPNDPRIRDELVLRFGHDQGAELFPLMRDYHEARMTLPGVAAWTLPSWRQQLTALGKVHPRRRADFVLEATAAPWRGFSRAASDSSWSTLEPRAGLNGRPQNRVLAELEAIANGQEVPD